MIKKVTIVNTKYSLKQITSRLKQDDSYLLDTLCVTIDRVELYLSLTLFVYSYIVRTKYGLLLLFNHNTVVFRSNHNLCKIQSFA